MQCSANSTSETSSCVIFLEYSSYWHRIIHQRNTLTTLTAYVIWHLLCPAEPGYTTEDNRLANSCLESTLASSSSENKKRKALSVCKSYTVLYNQATFFRQKYEDAYNRRYSTQLRGLT